MKEQYTVKFGRTNNSEFIQFLEQINLIVATHRENVEPTPTYVQFWQNMLDKNILAVQATRSNLNRIILNRKEIPNTERAHQTIGIVLNQLRAELPFLDEMYNFVQPKLTDDVFNITPKPAPDEEGWESPQAKNAVSQEAIKKSYMKAVTEKTPMQTTNAFSALETTPSPANDNPKPDDDHDLSFSSSSKAESSLTSPTDSKIAAGQEKEDQPVMNVRDEDKEPDLADDTEAFNFDDDTTIDMEETMIMEAIAGNTVNEIDVNILYRWINRTVGDIHTSSTHLTNHKKNITQLLDQHSVEVKNRMKNSYETEVKSAIDILTSKASQIRTQMVTTTESYKGTLNRAKQEFKTSNKDLSKSVKNFKSEMKKGESDAVMAINACGNKHITTITDNVEKGQQLQQQLLANIETAKESNRDVKHAITHLRTEIEQLYRRFSDDISDLADNERDEIRTWINENKSIIDGNSTVFAELQEERDLLKAERHLLRTERELLKKDRLEFENWYSEVKNELVTRTQLDKQTNAPTTPSAHKQQSLNTPSRSTPRFKADDPVQYSNNNYNVFAFIMNTTSPYFENEEWYYALYTAEGNKIYQCKESELSIVRDTVPPGYKAPPTPAPHASSMPFHQHKNSVFPPPSEHSSRYDSIGSSPAFDQKYETKPWQQPNYSRANRPLSDYEFIYPAGTYPKEIKPLSLYKAAKNWNLHIADVHDLRGFYERLQGHLSYFNILLRSYDDIVTHENIAAITPENCTNYEPAIQHMSKSILLMFEQNKKIFSSYPEPLGYMESFRTKMNGLDFVKKIMSKRHPNLRDMVKDVLSDHYAPTFSQSISIFTFINSYIEWLHDEFLDGGRQFSQLHQIKYVLNQLDTNTYGPAKVSIQEDLTRLNLNSTSPKPIPSHLYVDEHLGLYILDLLPESVRSGIYDDIASQEQAKMEDSLPTLNRLKDSDKSYYKKRDDKEYYKKKNDKDKDALKNDPLLKDQDNSWAKNLSWTIMKNQTCPACYKTDHNVYKTGCPAFAQFAVCNEFYKTVPKDKLDIVVSEYQKYQQELGKRKREKRNSVRKVLRSLKAGYHQDDIEQMKETLFLDYKNEFEDEASNNVNPFDNLDFEENDEEHHE